MLNQSGLVSERLYVPRAVLASCVLVALRLAPFTHSFQISDFRSAS